MRGTGKHRPLLKLPVVRQGAHISIVAPASFAHPERVELGLAALGRLGYVPRVAENGMARGPLFFAGTAEQRVADLHAAFADKDAQMVMCLRGGYGSNYVLPRLDLELIRRHPKPFFAYSDLTGVQLRLLDELGLPAFHGPMAAADFYLEEGVHLPSFHAALAGEPYSAGAGEGLRPLKRGTARGTLYGGCLSILVSLLGTPWEPATEGKLLFLEDTGAKPYQIDRMLWQLRQAGKLDGVSGIVFGEMVNCASPGTGPEFLEEVLARFLDDFEGPIAIGLRSGHVSKENVTLTLGVTAELRVNGEVELEIEGLGTRNTGAVVG
jgi:muramoyltetrapeptide carboxypeptidase